MEIIHNPKCFANHLGLYAIDPNWLTNALRLIKAGTWTPQAKAEEDEALGKTPPKEDDNAASPYYGDVGYQMYEGGLCVISMAGPMMKARSKYGGVSTIDARKALLDASRNPACTCIMLMIDSPGGSTAGTEQLGETVALVDTIKPVHAHIDDMGGSAAYWVASQARKITANSTALVGCIGTYSVIEDSSKKAEMEGVKVHVIASGGVKGGTVEGAPVSAEVLEHWQQIVNDSTEHFISAVASGRKMSKKAVSALADGRVHMAVDAMNLGLIDEVKSSNEVANDMIKKYTPKPDKAPAARSKNEQADTILKSLK